jgi:hypothetical protein
LTIGKKKMQLSRKQELFEALLEEKQKSLDDANQQILSLTQRLLELKKE